MEAKMVVLSMTIVMMSLFVEQASSKKGTYQAHGPYEAVYKRIENCGTEDSEMNFNIRVRKVSRTGIMAEGSIKVKNLTINNDVKLKSVLQLFTPSGWKDNYYIFDYGDKGLCTLSEELLTPSDLERISSGIVDENNVTMTKRCDIPPGEYTIKGINYDLTIPKDIPTTFFYGQYRIICHLYHMMDRSREVGCATMYVDLVAKKRPGG